MKRKQIYHTPNKSISSKAQITSAGSNTGMTNASTPSLLSQTLSKLKEDRRSRIQQHAYVQSVPFSQQKKLDFSSMQSEMMSQAASRTQLGSKINSPSKRSLLEQAYGSPREFAKSFVGEDSNKIVTSSKYYQQIKTLTSQQSSRERKRTILTPQRSIPEPLRLTSAEREIKNQQLLSNQIKIVEIDIERHLSRQRNSVDQALNSSSRSRSRKKKDTFSAQFNSFYEENVEEMAKIIGMKKKLELDILDRVKQKQELQKDIVEGKSQQNDLIKTLANQMEFQKFQYMENEQIQKNIIYTSDQIKNSYENIKKQLEDIQELKYQLKLKCDQDWSDTSQTIKFVDFSKQKSMASVGQVELNKSKAVSEIERLKTMISRNQQTETFRVETVQHKTHILRDLMKDGGQQVIVTDPKCKTVRKINAIIDKEMRKKSVKNKKSEYS